MSVDLGSELRCDLAGRLQETLKKLSSAMMHSELLSQVLEFRRLDAPQSLLLHRKT